MAYQCRHCKRVAPTVEGIEHLNSCPRVLDQIRKANARIHSGRFINPNDKSRADTERGGDDEQIDIKQSVDMFMNTTLVPTVMLHEIHRFREVFFGTDDDTENKIDMNTTGKLRLPS